MIGIYKVTNLVNQKCYIGQSTDISRRWHQHRTCPFEPSHTSYETPFYRAIRKYGIENFSFEVIEECLISELNQKEIYYIQLYHAYIEDNGYNLTLGGNNSAYKKLSEADISAIYNLLLNSTISQKEIAKQFNVGIDTISYINHGKSRQRDGYNYPLRNNQNDINYCQLCGKEIDQSSTYCVICNGLIHRKTIRPSKDELLSILYKNNGNFCQVANLYNVSDNAIRRWCDDYSISRYSKDYKNNKEKQMQTSKPVAKLDKITEEIIQIYPSLYMAELDNGNTQHISQVCRGIRKTCQGYKWKFITD